MQDTYSLFREFADSWALLALFLFFIGVIAWAFRPGSRPLHDDAALSIFHNSAEAAPRAPAPRKAGQADRICDKIGDLG